MTDLYTFPREHVGRKRYVGVRGHSKSVPAYKTYKGSDGYNHLRPEYGGSWDGLPNSSTYIVPDKAGYHSPLDGTVVEGRAAHREHMRVHNVVEVGDAPLGSRAAPERQLTGMRDDIRRAISERS